MLIIVCRVYLWRMVVCAVTMLIEILNEAGETPVDITIQLARLPDTSVNELGRAILSQLLEQSKLIVSSSVRAHV